MSRIGKMPIVISDKAEVIISWNDLKIKWPLWELSFTYSEYVWVKKVENTLVVSKLNDSWKALWWTTRSIINNMMIWVIDGYKKTLEINWVGYKFEVINTKLVLSIGYSHKVEMDIPKWIELKLDEKKKNLLYVIWTDKQLVWEFSAKIRSKKKPEPYKWKWIKYVWEHVRRKAGKTWAKW